MSKNISISLDTYFENFVNEIIKEGRFSNVSEVMKAGLRLLEEEENKNERLRAALLEGKNSNTVENFDRDARLKAIHKKYKKNAELHNQG